MATGEERKKITPDKSGSGKHKVEKDKIENPTEQPEKNDKK